MDAEFLAELDRDLTEVGLDEFWKREVGGRTVWISPVPFAGQAVINERMTDETLGVNFAFETKRMTLSYSIVGIGEKDLRPYRTKGPIFPFTDREGKAVKVTLQKYIYEKMANWGDTWIDAAFDVFADLMETHKANTLKKIEFENNKPPLDELVELELKAGKLRHELDMPQMTEVGSEAASAEEEESPEPEEESPGEEPPEEDLKLDFDPFEKVREGPVGPQEPVPRVTPGVNGPEGPQEEVKKAYRRTAEPLQGPPPLAPAPVQSVPIPQPPPLVQTPIQRELAKRAGQQAQTQAQTQALDVQSDAQTILDGQDHEKRRDGAMHSSKEAPLQAQPSVPIETVEQQAERKVVQPPKVNPMTRGQSQNPRFRGPGR